MDASSPSRRYRDREAETLFLPLVHVRSTASKQVGGYYTDRNEVPALDDTFQGGPRADAEDSHMKVSECPQLLGSEWIYPDARSGCFRDS